MSISTAHATGRAFSARGDREAQEDRYLIWEGHHPSVGALHIYAVFDGHAGTLCADICRTHLASLILQHPSWISRPAPVQAILEDAVLELEKRCLVESRANGTFDGTTLCAVVFAAGALHIAHVGDSRAVLIDSGQPKTLTTDHKPSAEREARRLCNARAVVKRGRLVGIRKDLDVSRSLGDRDFKDCAKSLLATPDLITHPVTPEQQALLLATDGLWDIDFLESELPAMALSGLTETSDIAGVAEDIVREAVRFRSRDNVTLVLVRLNVENGDIGEPVACEFVSYDHRPRVPSDVVCHHWEASPLPPSKSRVMMRKLSRIVRRPSWPGRWR